MRKAEMDASRRAMNQARQERKERLRALRVKQTEEEQERHNKKRAEGIYSDNKGMSSKGDFNNFFTRLYFFEEV